MFVFYFLSTLLVCCEPNDEKRLGGTRHGAELRAYLKDSFSPLHPLTYDEARLEMYGHVYNDPDQNYLEGLYTGVHMSCRYDTPSTSCNADLNCEHIVPQSFFKKHEPMRGDMHHLRPACKAANIARSNYKFGNIQGNVSKWACGFSITTETPEHPLECSKLSAARPFVWEPRETEKGDIARAVAYFYTMYPEFLEDHIVHTIDVDTMIEWSLQPPTPAQLEYSERIGHLQGNTNPYVSESDYEDLVARAFCDLSTVHKCEELRRH